MPMSEPITIFSIQVDIDVLAAARAVTLPHIAKHDIDMLIKTVLTEAFGGAVVRPWSLHRRGAEIATVLGYSAIPVSDIETRQAMALPAIRSAIKAVFGHGLPVLTAGQQFRYSVRLCPTIRITPSKEKSHAHGEIDAFLVAVQRGERNINREGVYTRYLTDCLKGASVNSAKLTRFRLQQISRSHRGASPPSSGVAQRVVPDGVLEGMLTVLNPTLLSQTFRSFLNCRRWPTFPTQFGTRRKR